MEQTRTLLDNNFNEDFEEIKAQRDNYKNWIIHLQTQVSSTIL